MSEHTPTPWTKMPHYGGKSYFLLDENGGVVASAVKGECADHINHCVNMHNELVAALDMMTEFAQHYAHQKDFIGPLSELLAKAKGERA